MLKMCLEALTAIKHMLTLKFLFTQMLIFPLLQGSSMILFLNLRPIFPLTPWPLGLFILTLKISLKSARNAKPAARLSWFLKA